MGSSRDIKIWIADKRSFIFFWVNIQKINKVENNNTQFVQNEFPDTSFTGIEGLEAADAKGSYNSIKDSILSLVDREEFIPNLWKKTFKN